MVTSDNGEKKSFDKPKYGEKKGTDKSRNLNGNYRGNSNGSSNGNSRNGSEGNGYDRSRRSGGQSYKTGNRDGRDFRDGGRDYKDGGRNFHDGKREGGHDGNREGGYRGGNSEKRYNNFKNSDGQNKTFKKRNNDRNYGNPYDKDEDDNPRPQKRQPAKDNKVKEQQPDKVEIINRIEKEKKAMQKKQAEKRNSKPSRVQSRPKRSNNIDWTREYENGSYDDDDLDMYL